MKRSPLKRKTGFPRAARAPKWLQRSAKIKAVNSKRSRAKHETNYGAEGVAVRSMPCLVDAAATASGKSDRELEAAGWSPCAGSIVAAHLLGARGMGGCGEFAHRLGLGPLCDAHHAQSGERRGTKRDAFEALYSIDCEAEAGRIALSHEPPLGVRGLAARWVAERTLANMDPELCPELEERAAALVRPLGVLGVYDLAALLGWVRRSSASTIKAQRANESDWVRAHPTSDDDKHDAIADVAHELGLVDAQGYPLHCVEALCELAGWPS